MSTLVKWIIGAVVGVVVVIMAFIQLDPKLNQDEEVNSFPTSEVIGMIEVRIEGQVSHPGIYTLEETSTLKDLISLAGGLLSTADTDSINEELPLKEVQLVYVPLLSGYSQNCVIDPNAKKVNINACEAKDLETINGISESIALRIIEYRETNGAFNSIEELMNVVGIGQKTYEKIRDYVTLK